MVATGLVTGSAGLPKPNVQCRSASLFAVRRWGACECTGHAGPTIRTEGAGMASARTTTIVNGKRGAHDRSGAAGVSASGGPEKAVAFLANFASKSTAMLGLQAVLQYALRALRDDVGFDACAVALVDENDASAFVIRAASGLCARSRGLAIPRGKGVHGVVAGARQPVLVSDI